MTSSRISSVSTHLATALVGILAVGIPLLSLPLTNDYYDLPKRMAILVVVLSFAGIYCVRSFFERRIRMSITAWTLPVVLLIASSIATMVFASVNKPMALFGNGGLIIGIGLFFLFSTTLIKKPITTLITNGLFIAGSLVTMLSVLEAIGIHLLPIFARTIGATIPDTTPLFPTGGPIVSALFLTVTLAMAASTIWSSKTFSMRLLAGVFSTIFCIGLILNLWLILPGKTYQPRFISFLDSWSIALDVSKDPRRALLGVGTDAFPSAYTVFRPINANQASDWMYAYASARNVPLDIFTTMGTFGLIAWASLVLVTLRKMVMIRREHLPVVVGMGTTLLISLFFPPTTTMLFLSILLMSAIALVKHHGNEQEADDDATIVSLEDASPKTRGILQLVFYSILTVSLTGTLSAFYLISRAYAAETVFGASLRAVAKNDAKSAYDQATLAIRLNPYQDQFRRSFALTNLSIAQALTQKQELNDQEKQTAISLIEQAIAQAKMAVSLDSTNVSNWDTLSTVYQSLIGSVEQADQWTVASYVQSIQRNPTDPRSRLALAGVYRKIGNTQEAIRMLEQAAQLKPDYANAYFNLADIYKSTNAPEKELQMLGLTLQSLRETDAEYVSVKTRAEELAKKIEEGKATQSAQKTTPTPTPTPIPLSIPPNAGMSSGSGIPEVRQ